MFGCSREAETGIAWRAEIVRLGCVAESSSTFVVAVTFPVFLVGGMWELHIAKFSRRWQSE